MGGLIELILAYGIFLVCLSMGVVSIYDSLAAQGNLYELRDNGVNIELASREDARVYAAFVSQARSYSQAAVAGSASCNLSPSNFQNIPNGYSVQFQRPPSSVSGSFSSVASLASGSPVVVAQLLKGSTVIAEYVLQC